MHVTMQSPESEVLTRRQAAERLGVTSVTLARWAMQGRGPRYSLTGRAGGKGRALYSAASIAAWMQERRCERQPPYRGVKSLEPERPSTTVVTNESV